MISSKHRKVIRLIHEKLDVLDTIWAITGSLGFALHGMDVPVNDVDLQTDQNGAYQIENVFRSNVTRSVEFSESRRIRSYFGELDIQGLKVEIMGALQKRLPNGTWEPPVDVEQHREFVDFEGMRVPVLSLEYEEQAYRRLGRTKKAEKIRQWLIRASDQMQFVFSVS